MSSSPAPDRRRVARSLGLFFVCAPALGVLLIRGAGDRAPVRVLKGLLTLATVFIAGMCVISGSTQTGFAYLFLWATPYAFFFGRRHAIAQGVIAAVGLVGAHALVDGNPLSGPGIDDWLIPVATLVVVGGMMHRLIGELGRAGLERLRSERERAELEAGRASSEAERAPPEAAVRRPGRLA